MKLINTYGNLVGRLLISVMFLGAGISKITGYAGTQGYMEAMGVPGALLPLVIALEIFGALAIIIGYKTKAVAFLLAGFSIVSALLFHYNFADQMQAALFMKNIAIAGGFMFLVVNGAGPLSIDNKLNK
jgi:putative oxidoreductase